MRLASIDSPVCYLISDGPKLRYAPRTRNSTYGEREREREREKNKQSPAGVILFFFSPCVKRGRLRDHSGEKVSQEHLNLRRNIPSSRTTCTYVHTYITSELGRRRSTVVKRSKVGKCRPTNVSTSTFRSASFSFPFFSLSFSLGSRVYANMRQHIGLSFSASILVDSLATPFAIRLFPSPALATPRARQPSSFLRLDHLEALNLFAENIKRRQIS